MILKFFKYRLEIRLVYLNYLISLKVFLLLFLFNMFNYLELLLFYFFFLIFCNIFYLFIINIFKEVNEYVNINDNLTLMMLFFIEFIYFYSYLL